MFCDKLFKNFPEKSYIFFFIIGIIYLGIYYLPYFINGENSIYRIHDYLEQDFVHCALSSKYFFNPLHFNINELFNGTYRSSIQTHSLLQIIAYKLVKGVTFLNLNQLLTAFLGYCGMFLLVGEVFKNENKFVVGASAMLSSLVFAELPLLLTGATIMSIPLIAWISIKMFNSGLSKTVRMSLLAVLFVISLGTSLIYGEFVILGVLFLTAFYLGVLKKNKAWVNYLSGFSVMLLGYLINYFYTFASLQYESHRVEWVIESRPFCKKFLDLFIFGKGETDGFFLLIVSLTAVLLLIALIRREKTREVKIIAYSAAVVFLISFTSAFYDYSGWIVDLRQNLGILKSFQFNRIAYLSPACMYFLMAADFVYTYKLFCGLFEKRLNKNLIILFYLTIIGVFFGFQLSAIQKNDDYHRQNFKAFKGKETGVITYKEFFEEDLMKEIQDYINKPLDSYRVVSLGINPGVALFSGFYCLDGYSTNYSLEYKHKFRKVIAKELSKNAEHAKYFDEWGHRCYIVSSELPFRQLDKTSGLKVKNLELDYRALKDLGCNYILSVVKIKENKYLKLEKVFKSKVTLRKVYLYSLT